MKDLEKILRLFEQAMELQGKNGYMVWSNIDKAALIKDIENGMQYKIADRNDIACIFSVQLSDPYVWRDRDRNDAVYLHRVVADPDFKGQRLFQNVLDWTMNFVRERKRGFIRMDTWASNEKILAYYKTFGFEFIEYFKTPDTSGLPVQNRGLHVALLELTITA